MSIRVITIEREYGSGGAAIAQALAQRLGWKLWDEELTAEIARIAHVDAAEVQRRDECMEAPLPRLFKVFARGSYERALPIQGFDTDQMVVMLERVILGVASRGECVIVGRGSPYILRHRPDACHFFIYAPLEEKVHRLGLVGKSQKEARELLAQIDRERATFIRHYFSKDWPTRSLYDLMINSKYGDERVIETILQHVEAMNERQARV
jgi:cytidylate kinase